MQLLYLCIICSAYAQHEKIISFEIAGSGGVGSVNFEHEVLDREHVHLYMRYGFSVAPINRNSGTVLIFPVMLHTNAGNEKHWFDAGIGQTISITTKGRMHALLPLSFGYRFQPPRKQYYLRAAYTPIVSYLFDFQLQHWGGITVAYVFKSRKDE